MIDVFYLWFEVTSPIILLFYLYYESKEYITFNVRSSNTLWFTAAIVGITVVAVMYGLKHILH